MNNQDKLAMALHALVDNVMGSDDLGWLETTEHVQPQILDLVQAYQNCEPCPGPVEVAPDRLLAMERRLQRALAYAAEASLRLKNVEHIAESLWLRVDALDNENEGMSREGAAALLKPLSESVVNLAPAQINHPTTISFDDEVSKDTARMLDMPDVALEPDVREFGVTFVINGDHVSIVVSEGEGLRTCRDQALRDSHNTGRPLDEWEVRSEAGILMDLDSPIGDQCPSGTTLYTSLGVGCGGADRWQRSTLRDGGGER